MSEDQKNLRNPNVQQMTPEQAVISMKNQLVIIEDSANEGRKLVQNQLYALVLQTAEAFKQLSEQKIELEEEYDRVIRICMEHNIDVKPAIKFKNRKERRKQESPGITKIS